MDNTDRSNTPKRRIRVEDVARIAGVSPITVSRTLSNPELVREATRERVLQAVEETGYVVNATASNLRSGRSTMVSMFVSNLHDPHFTQAVQGCSDALKGSGLHLMMAQTSYSEEAEAEIVASVLPMRPAALVFTSVIRSEPVRSILRDSGIPVMEMWELSDDPLDMLVGFCNRSGGHLMGRHFAGLGFRNTAYAGQTLHSGSSRLEGFREALTANRVELGWVETVEAPHTLAAGRQAFEAVMAQDPACEAIFFGTDILALGALLHAERYQGGRYAHVAIAGYGDIVISRELHTPLTSVHVSGYDMGYKAGEMLLARLAGSPLANKVVMCPVSLMPRASTVDRAVRAHR